MTRGLEQPNNRSAATISQHTFSPSLLSRLVKRRGLELGLDGIGVTSASPPRSFPRFLGWLRLGFHGEMSYMDRHREKRADPRSLLPDAQSVIVGCLNYYQPLPEPQSTLVGKVARYGLGRDYHKVLTAKLRALLDYLRALIGAKVEGHICVDSGPILERDFAVRAGLGWIGKNTCLIDPRKGSYLFLGELLVNVPLEPDRPFERNHCGKCQRCLIACPTGALVGPYLLDSRRCISYLTIELRGSIPRELRPLMGTWIFGCDICQEVCPWNRKAVLTREEQFRPRPWSLMELIDIVRLTEDEFRNRFSGSALMRAKRRGLVRNACVALGNLRDPSVLPVLRQLLMEDPDPIVREHAAWAIGRLGTFEARATLLTAVPRETDPAVLQEIHLSLIDLSTVLGGACRTDQ